MRCAAKDLVDCSINVGVPIKIAVSVDGTWQKRYGYNSLLGATFVISIENSLVYSIKCKICSVCKKNLNATKEWKEDHASNNHLGSSGSMEKEGAVEMFLRSVDIGDGDTNSFCAVSQALQIKFGMIIQ